MFSSFERSELDGRYAPSVSCVGVIQITSHMGWWYM